MQLMYKQKIKEYRHSRIKGKQIDQFYRLLKKDAMDTIITLAVLLDMQFLMDTSKILTIPMYSKTVTSSATTRTTAPTAPTTTTTSANTSIPAHTTPFTKTSGSSTYSPPPHPCTGNPSSQGNLLHYSAQAPSKES